MTPTRSPILCPSSQPDVAGSVVFGVVGGTVEAPRVGYLTVPVELSSELLDIAAPVEPAEVFRFAAPCAGAACTHFERGSCRLAQRVSRTLPVVSNALPPCAIRSDCRWWRQEGPAACARCPQIVTTAGAPDARLRYVALGPSEAGAR